MAVHILGNTTAPSTGYNTSATYNEVAPHSQLNMPANGYVSKLYAHFGVSGGTNGAKLLLVNGLYNLDAISGTFYAGTVGWQSIAITPFYKGSGNSITVGWFIPSGLTNAFYVYSTGLWEGGSVSSPTGISGFSAPGSPYYQGGTGWYVEWLDPLTVSSVSPNPAAPGQTVTIGGSGFQGGSITGIDFNGTAASGWTVVNDTTLTVQVPVGATTGNITVSSDHGNGSVAFTVSSAHVFRSGAATNGQGVYVVRTGTPSMAQGVLRWKNGAWVNGQ